MRHILLATLIGLGLGASVQAIAGQIPPNMIYDCERPQLAALSKELGRTVCVQYDIVESMNIQGMKVMAPAIEAAARAAVSHSTKVEDSADADAISCRENDVAFRTPSLICARNSDWNQQWRRSFPEGRPEPYYSENGGAMAPPLH